MSVELEPVYQYILEELRIPFDSVVEKGVPIHIGNRELQIDLTIKSKDTLTIIEFKSKINEDIIYKIFALSHLIDKEIIGGRKLQLVCAGKLLKFSAKELAEKFDVRIVLIPQKLYNHLAPMVTASDQSRHLEYLRASQSRITSEKAWKIVCSLFAETFSSILSISKKTGVSYAWTNAIIHKLEDSGIVANDYGLRIKDLGKLLNAVSWERALEGLLVDTINTDFSTATQCINEVALNLNKLGIDYAFTAHSAAIYYGSSIMREDTAYIYLPTPSDKEVVRSYSTGKKEGCRLKVYIPERNVMKSSRMINGIRVVDVCQIILDLAGLGIDGRTAAKDLVNSSVK
ncbi:MAG: hypothetical protein ACYCR7_04075 [Thermoplasmataceae archaeon]